MSWTVADLMTPEPRVLAPNTSVMNAAHAMRMADVGTVLVMEGEELHGILTDRDIVVRAIAAGRDPLTTPVGEVCSRVLVTVSPETGVGEAVRLMREHALRRLPVVEKDGRVTGIVSIGDIAVARDRRSALGDISAAPANV